ncbi:sensor histidine kinase [Streptomyces sp. NPDC046928]|uniref:sensor histidine kinase n=1 Tax=Streptomyces sp. NPDC046928 TaxID=3155021 RepID=UPI0033CBFC23
MAWLFKRQGTSCAGARDETPAPSGYSLLPWLLLGLGSLSNLFHGETANPLIGGLGLLAFNSLYVYVAFRSFVKETREAPSTRVALVLMTGVTCVLALAYGGTWLLFFPLLGLATGAAVRFPHLRPTGAALGVLAGAVAVSHDGWDGLGIAYATWISTMVTAAILSLSDAVRQLRAAREELAHRAVEQERLSFSRDLHDLLGHTLSVVVVKAEAARRLTTRDVEAAQAQLADIESVGRQALTEIREAVTGYREGSLSREIDGAVSALRAAGVEPVVRRSGPPLAPQTEALLGWVVREAATNVVRHSGASRCEIAVTGDGERARLTVTDDGRGTGHPRPTGGTGLRGLTERLATAGGTLTAGPERGGFAVTAELPTDAVEGAGHVVGSVGGTDGDAVPATAGSPAR